MVAGRSTRPPANRLLARRHSNVRTGFRHLPATIGYAVLPLLMHILSARPASSIDTRRRYHGASHRPQSSAWLPRPGSNRRHSNADEHGRLPLTILADAAAIIERDSIIVACTTSRLPDRPREHFRLRSGPDRRALSAIPHYAADINRGAGRPGRRTSTVGVAARPLPLPALPRRRALRCPADRSSVHAAEGRNVRSSAVLCFRRP